MVDIGNKHPDAKVLIKESAISPGFFTTNIDKLSSVNTFGFEETFGIVMEKLENDHLIDLLEKYCAAEYSGFIVYKELSHQLRETNYTLANGFSLMSRDEARHASFLNKALLDFHLKPNLSFLKKEDRKYISLPLSWFIYSTYLSERLSSCYYITIFEHLKSHPEYSVYPLFEFYKSWSEDENRHGDFFGAIIKTQSWLSYGLQAKLTCKFYLLLIFSVMYLRQKDNEKIFSLFGLDSLNYYVSTIKTVNESIRKDLPVILDLENSSFFSKLDACIIHITENESINLSNKSLFVATLKKIPHYFALIINLLSLLLVKSIDTQAI